MEVPKYLGDQYIIELYKCDSALLDDIPFIEQLMHKAAIAAGATVVQQFFHKFSPQGVSGTIVIAESHLNIHTWPEFGFAAVDIFTCGESLHPDKALDVMKQELKSERTKLHSIKRGLDIGSYHL